MDAYTQGGRRALELISVLCHREGSVPWMWPLQGQQKGDVQLLWAEQNPTSAGARQKVACPSHPSHPPAVEEPRAELHIWVQSSPRHSSGGVLLTGSLYSDTRRCGGTAPTKPPLKPLLRVA